MAVVTGNEYVDHPLELPHLSIAAGYGGLDLALGSVFPTLRTVAYVEVEAYACANLVRKMEAGALVPAPVWTDLRTFRPEPFRRAVAVLSAGYPCQPFSLAGKRRGAGDPRHLWPIVARTIDVVGPGLVFLENVRGHVSLGLRQVRCDLEAMGYRVDAEICAASEVGAGHRRERVFILAHADRDELRQQLRRWRWAEGGKAAQPRILSPGGDASDTDDRGQPEQPEQHRRPQAGQSAPQRDDAVGRGAPGAPPDAHGLGLEERRPLRERCADAGGSDRRSPQPGLGGSIHAPTHRVDRLRLAGNGVVPAQAAFALRLMLNRIGSVTP